MASWQPIETAPKDETIILVCGQNQRGNWYHDIVIWLDDEWCCFDPPEDCYCWPVESPTHWMPLPEAPTIETNSSIPKPTSST